MYMSFNNKTYATKIAITVIMSLSALSVVIAQNFDIERSQSERKRIVALGLDTLMDVAYKLTISKEYDKAIQIYSHILEQDKNRSDLRVYALCKRGDCKMMLKDYESAIRDCEESINTSVDIYSYVPFANDSKLILSRLKILAYMTLSTSYINTKNYQEALFYLNLTIKSNQNDIKATYWRGIVYHKLQDYSSAILDFTKVINQNQGYEYSYSLRGNSKMELQDYRGAIKDYNKAVVFDDNDYESFHNRGLSKLYLGGNYEALKDFNRAIELHPNESSYNARADVKFELSDYRGAINDITNAIEFNPKKGKSYCRRGSAKLRIGQTESGCMDYSQAGELGYFEAYELIKQFCND